MNASARVPSHNDKASSMSSARVSVILPVLNQAKYLPLVLPALLNQESTASVEIIVVDNGSDDASMQMAETYPGVTIHEERIRGAYAARNKGILSSTGDIIVFLDPDCIPHPCWLSSALTALSDPRIMVALGSRLPSSPGPVKWLQSYENSKIQWVIESRVAANVYAYTNNMATRRVLFDRHGLFPMQARGADTLFAQHIAHTYGVHTLVYVPEMCVTHLELEGVGSYFRKRIIYGKSNSDISMNSNYRSLSLGSRLAILKQMQRQDSLPPWSFIFLVMLLVTGSLLYDSASLINRKRVRISCKLSVR